MRKLHLENPKPNKKRGTFFLSEYGVNISIIIFKTTIIQCGMYKDIQCSIAYNLEKSETSQTVSRVLVKLNRVQV